MKLTKKPGAPTITIILIGIVHLVAFGWLAYSTDKMLYKIFFGVMGVLLFIGIVDKIKEKPKIDSEEGEKPKDS